MDKINNLFPVLFALAGISMVVWGIAAGAASESTAMNAEAAVVELPIELESYSDEL